MKIKVFIKTGKKESNVIKKDFAEYEVWVKARPVKGDANKELLVVLAKYFDIKKYQVRLISGLMTPIKIVEISE